MRKLLHKTRTMIVCPFCKKDIASSKKTEIHYRSHWIKGCFECFALSISEATNIDFQQKSYE